MNPGDSNASFIILFTDLSIILLAFLIFLNALSLPDTTRLSSAITSVGEEFPGLFDKRSRGQQKEFGFTPEAAQEIEAKSFSERYASIASVASRGGFSVKSDENSFLISIAGASLFTARDAQLTVSALPTLRSLASEIVNHSLRAEVSVHSDSSSQPDYYQQSLREGASLARFFADSGLHAPQIHFEAFGEYQPIVSGLDKNSSLSNHRLDIRIFVDKGI